MTLQSGDHYDDQELEDFLQGKGELAQMFKRLPLPEPSDALTEKILARIKMDLAREKSANDAVMVDHSQGRARLMFSRFGWEPFALAASVVLGITLIVQMQNPKPSEELRGASTKDAPSQNPLAAASSTPLTTSPVIAAAPTPNRAPASIEPVASNSDPIKASTDIAKANAGLKQIDKLIKAGEHKGALEAWKKFQREFPQHPVPAQLKERIQKLEK